jgi:haloacetate dehalogenase
MFEHFEVLMIDTGEADIRVRRGGDGPPLLLLHGFPQTHIMWHKVAPRLAQSFTVVVMDLRGYGDSSKPPSEPDHTPYSKRAMARDCVAVMSRLGHDRFCVAGHDRGGRCAYRLAVDHPDRVERLAVLDIVPIGDALARADASFALAYWLWFFLAQPSPLPERLIGSDPAQFAAHLLDEWSDTPGAITDDARAEYLRWLAAPGAIQAVCEEYRAAVTLDRSHDEMDRGRQKIRCPLLALWSGRGPMAQWYDPLEIWRGWAHDVRGRALDCGHFLPEEAADETYAELHQFFSSDLGAF